VPGVAAPKKVTILLPKQQIDTTEFVVEYLETLEQKNQTQTADKLRAAAIAAAPAIGVAIADAVERLAKTLENKESTQLEIVKARAAVADASAQIILVALQASRGNQESIILPITKNAKLPDLEPGKSMIIAPTGSESGKVTIVANSTVLLSSPKENLYLAMTAIDTTGEQVPVTKNNSIKVDHGQSLAMTGSGFKPKSEVKIWMFSDPRSIGTVITDANGSFAAEVPMPDNLVPGDHTAQVNGNNKNGSVRSLNLGLEVDLPAETPEAKPKKPSIARSTNIYFRGDDSKLFWGAVSQLKKLLPKLRKARTVEVIGYSHSKTRDNNQFNIELSKTRAENVAAWLRQRKIGVVSVEQFGYDKRSARTRPRLNRRVEIRWSD
jgi:outer membrane protein OmpA-like peptidoglycan-associated protein